MSKSKDAMPGSQQRMVSPLEEKFLSACKRHKNAEIQAARFTSKAATMGLALMYSRMIKAADELAQDIEKRANQKRSAMSNEIPMPFGKMMDLISRPAIVGVGESSFAAPQCSPALPNGLTRFEVIEGLRELRNDAVAAEKLKNPDFVRWQDLDAILEYIEQHGLPAPENAEVSHSDE